MNAFKISWHCFAFSNSGSQTVWKNLQLNIFLRDLQIIVLTGDGNKLLHAVIKETFYYTIPGPFKNRGSSVHNGYWPASRIQKTYPD